MEREMVKEMETVDSSAQIVLTSLSTPTDLLVAEIMTTTKPVLLSLVETVEEKVTEMLLATPTDLLDPACAIAALFLDVLVFATTDFLLAQEGPSLNVDAISVLLSCNPFVDWLDSVATSMEFSFNSRAFKTPLMSPEWQLPSELLTCATTALVHLLDKSTVVSSVLAFPLAESKMLLLADLLEQPI